MCTPEIAIQVEMASASASASAASLTTSTIITSISRPSNSTWFFFNQNGATIDTQKPRLLLSCNPTQWRGLRHVFNPISALGSGLEVSITDPDELISLKDAKIVVESQDENNIQVRVDLTGDGTQKVFDKVLTNLARSAPPMPGFRREKGGKTSKVPKSLLLQVLGKERVTKFVIQEIVSSTMTDYTKKENLKVKDKKINTTQTAKELRKLFTPGKDFGFNAVMELEKSEAETSSSSSSDA